MSDLTYHTLGDKPLVWLGSELKSPPLSPQARREAGALLRLLQRGQRLSLPQCRPLPAIDAGCAELRVNDGSVSWRVVHCIEPGAIVVLDVFAKKTRATPRTVITRCKARLRLYRQAVSDVEVEE